MESATSGRRRGPTKHSVEDQALDQIAKERIVSFGSGSSNENSSASVPSKTESIHSENQDVIVRQNSKKKKKKRRKTKTIEPVDDNHKDETDEEEVEEVDQKKHEIPEEVDNKEHEIPEKFYDDLSETDVSKTGNSTTEDISTSDLSENPPLQQSADVDFWADHPEDELVGRKKSSENLAENVENNENINFDDFWADFDKHDGQTKKESAGENIEEAIKIEENCEEVDNIDNFWSDREDDLPPITEIKLIKKQSESFDNGSNYSERDRSMSKDSMPDDSVYMSLQKDKSASKERSKSKEKSPVQNKNYNNREDTPEGSSLGKDSSPDLNVNSGKKSKSKSSTPNQSGKERSMSKDSFPEDKMDGSLDIDRRKSKSKSSTPHQSSKDRSMSNEPLPDDSQVKSSEKEKRSSKSNSREKSKSKSKEKSPKLKKGKSQSKENTPDAKEIEKSESQLSMSSHIHDTSQEENADLDNKEKKELTYEESKEMGFSAENNVNLVDNENTLDYNENNDVDILEQNDGISEINKDSENTESFWNDSESDIPPVFTLKALKKDEEISFIENNEKAESPESSTESVDSSSTSNESDNTSEDKKTASEEIQHTEEKEDLNDKKEIDKLRDEKEFHRRNFAKALQDIEAPVRRRSVLVLDNRERISVEVPPPLESPRSQHYSESSTDGEASHDDGIMDFLGKENDRAEARLAARRQARVEARDIRMRELERVQKEQEETGDKVFDLHSTPAHLTTPPHITPSRQPNMSPRERPTSTNSYHSSRRSSEDSMEDGLSLRDIRHELKEVEEKFRKAMIANAQLDNEKAALAYQVELLKDKLEDLEEMHSQLGKEHRERCREHEALKRAALKLKEELVACKMYLEERDILIADYGLIIVGGEIDEKGETTPRALVSSQSAQVLESAGEGSLDVRLKTLYKEKNDLVDEVRHLKLELEEERNGRRNEQTMTNGPIGDEVQQTLNDYRFRLQKAEQDTSTLQATVARLESQVIRYKSAAEESEKAEDELKQEKRKLLREHRESIARIEELETSNSHLQRRMDKLKNAKSTLLKEL